MIVLYILIGVLALGALYLFMMTPALSKNANMEAIGRLDIAHRGLYDNEAGIPENSLAAFSRAIEHGFAIEMDVQVTADDRLVVFHDAQTERMTGVVGRIKNMTLEEIEKLRLLGTEEHIPTFEEFLALVDGRVPLCIEFKGDTGNGRHLAKCCCEVLDRYKGPFYMESFYPGCLIWVRHHRPDMGRGQLATAHGLHFAPADFFLRNLLFNFLTKPHFIAYDCRYSRKCWAPRLCRSFFRIVPVEWTVDGEARYRENQELGITNIFEGFIPKG